MSHHISNNDPKQPCECTTPAVSKHNITPKDLERGGCGCHPQDLNPSRLDQVIAQYEAMTKEAEAARDRFINAAERLEDVATETNATANKTTILATITSKAMSITNMVREDIEDFFAECSEQDVIAMWRATSSDGYAYTNSIYIDEDGWMSLSGFLDATGWEANIRRSVTEHDGYAEIDSTTVQLGYASLQGFSEQYNLTPIYNN